MFTCLQIINRQHLSGFTWLMFFRQTFFLTLIWGLISTTYADTAKKSVTPFSHESVVKLAEALASQPFVEPPSAPESLTSLDYSTYRQINFQQNAAVWGNTPTRFSVQLFAPGYLFNQLVDIDVVENGKAVPVEINEQSFRVPEPSIAQILADVGKYAGLRLHYPINKDDYQDEFVVFQGASYFRAVSKGQSYGISARGLAIDVAEQHGEEFPLFKRFWIERPAKGQYAIVVHALLDSKSVTGAYRFGIYPGDSTRMDVTAVLFPRRDLAHIGLAPLTSMFMHGPLVRSKVSDYRPAVHDSEALAIERNNGEWVWRPLNNPANLQISAFADVNPKGFGLIQRQRKFEGYQDLEATYQNRPSAWVEPMNDWGEGAVQLVEIPSNAESNDNIIAYWRPADVLKQGEPYEFSYRLTWPNDIRPSAKQARVVRSAAGVKLFTSHQEVVIDYAGLDAEQVKDVVVNASISQGNIVETIIQTNPETQGARVFVIFDPDGADMAELRVQLTQNAKPVAETWLFRWINRRWLP